MPRLVVDTTKCTGCRACEVACSYHHRRAFNPRLASLQVRREERTGAMTVTLYPDLPLQMRSGRPPCDLCAGEAQPLCARYCAPGAIVTIVQGSTGGE